MFSSYQIVALPRCFQIDIVLLPQYKAANNGKDKFLLLVDVPSRRAFAYAVKSGQMRDVIEAYGLFLDDVGSINRVTGDNFFRNRLFETINETNDVKLYTSIAEEDHMTNKGNRLGIIDRLTRTLKNYIQRYVLLKDDMKWTAFLEEIMDMYNHLPHSSLNGESPIEAFENQELQNAMYVSGMQHNARVANKEDFEEGDVVRVMKKRGRFAKEAPLLKAQLYSVVKDGNKYALDNDKDEPVRRRFRASEMRKYDGVAPLDNNKEVKENAKRERTARRIRQEGIEPVAKVQPTRAAREAAAKAREDAKKKREAAERLKKLGKIERLPKWLLNTLAREGLTSLISHVNSVGFVKLFGREQYCAKVMM